MRSLDKVSQALTVITVDTMLLATVVKNET